MASPPFNMEDQMDEYFFHKLVDSELDGAESNPGFLENVESNDAKECGKLSIDEVGAPLDGLDNLHNVEVDHDKKGDKEDSISCKLDDKVENESDEDDGGVLDLSELVNTNSVLESSDHVVGVESATGLMNCNNGQNTVAGVKEVQWSAFSGGTQEASYSDFFNEIGDNSADLFGEIAGGFVVASDPAVGVSSNQTNCSSSYVFVQNEVNQQHGSCNEHTPETKDHSSSQYWENLYPGWRYDPNTGQWHQLDGSDAMATKVENYNGSSQLTFEGAAVDKKSDVYYLQQSAQSIAGSMNKESTTGTLSYRNETTQGSTNYPSHMVFDPQYPGWYYDTIALQWRSLDSYTSSISQSTSSDNNQQMSNGSVTTGSYNSVQNMIYGQGDQVNSYALQRDQLVDWRDSATNHDHQDMNTAHPDPFGNNKAISSPQNTPFGNGYISSGHFSYSTDHKTGVTAPGKSALYERTSQGFDSGNGFNRFQGFNDGVSGFNNFAPAENVLQQNNYRNMEFDQLHSAAYFSGSEVLNFSQQPLQNSKQLPYASSEERSSAGHPPHALVTFGFGGKFIVMKDQSSLHTHPAYATQDSAGGVINILDVMEVVMLKSGGGDARFMASDYFHTLCQQSFPGPLVSGNVGSKELNKWIDDRIAKCGLPDVDCKGEVLKTLFSVLKIACQYYGKLRSSFAPNPALKENDCPESALAELFASVKRNGLMLRTVTHCLQNMPSEGQMRATADAVQMLLVSGRRMEALQCAQEGHLWGAALVIAALLGEQFYGEAVKQMALHQLVAGSPLRILFLLLAGQPAEVFSNSIASKPPSGVNVPQPEQVGLSGMLDEWEENLAIITANRTKGDELVITHLGDCLWKERGEVTTAHICYLVAEANMESYSESARLCLVGADHLKSPRTYASPEAIQRTELYEYAKVLGNSQFILLPFQPYKLIYACMLAEVGKMSDSLKYCQAILKSLKAARSPEVDAWRHMVSSFEERIRIHLQGGYATNLAPAKLVGKLLNFFDNTAHRVVGGLPPPIPSTSLSNGQWSERDQQSRGPRVSSSQSTMAMSSLIPSASVEGSSRKSLHNRSISEPDIGRTPRKVESPEKISSSSPLDSTSVSGGSSRFGRFGSQIFQKTVGLVLRSRPDCQAKLGETNKFYYDEKLKRWVEEGSEPPAEEVALAPPPTTAAFTNHGEKYEPVNGITRANGETQLNSGKSVENSSGMPPVSSASNQFSARGRMGVRARYVDTFNKGGGTQANLYQSPPPSVPATKPASINAKFFIPTPASAGEETNTTQGTGTQEAIVTEEDTTTSSKNHSFSSPTIHRHPSMGSIPMMKGNGPLPSNSRRTLSWSGGLESPVNHRETRPLGEALGFPSSTYMPGDASSMPFSSPVADNLQEVEL